MPLWLICNLRLQVLMTSGLLLAILALFSAPVASAETSRSTTAFAPRIVGGTDAEISDYPWQVALMTADNFQFCGGSILSKHWVVTAAHCYSEELRHIRAGVTDKTSSKGQDVPVARQIRHPAYDDRTTNNDIMLLELAGTLDLSGARAKPIAWMTPEAAATGLQEPGVQAVITGWGALAEDGPGSDILQRAAVPIVSNAKASRAYDAVLGPGVITPQMLPAGYMRGGIDACLGDSGGPLVVPDAAVELGYRLAGVTSWGLGCALPGFPGLYARVSEFSSWIDQYVGDPAPSPETLCPDCLPSQGGWRAILGR